RLDQEAQQGQAGRHHGQGLRRPERERRARRRREERLTMSLGDWELEVTGVVRRIDRENTDKSGRNPRFTLSIVVEPERVVAPPEAKLPVELAIRIADREIARFGGEPAVGARVTMKARANGPNPATFYLTAITRS